jgi:hypothetical protein
MIVLAQVDVGEAVEEGLATVTRVVPQLLSFLLILVIGYFIAKLVSRVIARVLERVGFDRAVERGGVKRALDRTKYDPSDILGKIAFYTLFLFVLQLAFGVFGDNPISDLITGVIAYLPRVFVAIVIIVVAAAVAAAVRELVQASLGGLSYGTTLAFAASAAVLAVGAFAALDQLGIAPAIVNGLFYAILAIVVGVVVVAVGGGGIQPMRAQWEKSLARAQDEAPRVAREVQGSSERIKDRAETRKDQVTGTLGETEPLPRRAGGASTPDVHPRT